MQDREVRREALSPMSLGEGSPLGASAAEWAVRAEDEVARATFQALVETAPDGILVADQDGRIVFVNTQLERMLGYHREELLGQPIEILIPERFRAAHVGHRVQYHAGPRTRLMGLGLELYARRKDGSELSVEISLSPTRTEQSLLVTSIIRDITERKRGEEERARLLRAEQAARAEAETAQRRLELLYRTQKEIAGTLQRSLLPPQLPSIPGVELAPCFRPAGEGVEVGGDFYDVFETIDGTWALVIGDVTGKGPAAAAVTALARHTVRTVATRSPSPAEVLFRTNEAMLPQLSEDSFCTLLYACVQPTARGLRVSFASGGHPLPLLLHGSGGSASAASAEMVGRPGMIIGVAPNPRFPEQVLDLGPGDALVFYTDGVTEARAGGEFFGEERLAALVQACAGLGARSMVERIEQTVVGFQSGRPSDDIAVLVLRVPF